MTLEVSQTYNCHPTASSSPPTPSSLRREARQLPLHQNRIETNPERKERRRRKRDAKTGFVEIKEERRERRKLKKER